MTCRNGTHYECGKCSEEQRKSCPEYMNSELGIALQHIGMLLEFCDLNGYGKHSITVSKAREFWAMHMTTNATKDAP